MELDDDMQLPSEPTIPLDEIWAKLWIMRIRKVNEIREITYF